MRALGRLKPGWYLLIVLLLYAVVASIGWRRDVVALRELRLDVEGVEATAAPATLGASEAAAPPPMPGDVGLWLPVPGARIPSEDDHLPGAPRAYRAGVSEGFVFWPDSSGAFIGYGTPVIATGPGRIARVDEPYTELDEEAWEMLLTDVADGATEAELDRLRGRQVWIELDDGRVARYGHLADVRAGLTVGQRVGRGRVIGFVGNSGTLDGVLGRTSNARLHFELREGDGYVGADLDPEGVRLLASSLFTGAVTTPSDRRPEAHEITAIETLWRNVWVRGTFYLVLAAAIVLFLVTQRGAYGFALQVALAGFLIAYILNPVVVALGRLRIGRGLAVVIVYLILAQALVIGSVLLTQVVTETARFASLLPSALGNLSDTLGSATGWFGGIGEWLSGVLQDRLGIELGGEDFAVQLQTQVVVWLTSAAQSLTRFLERVVADGPAFLLQGATSIVSGAFQVVMIAIASAYLLYDFPRITSNLERFVPVRWRTLYGDLTTKADSAIGGYLRGQILITIILGFLIWIGLTVLGVPLATAISVLAAVFNLVPYLGPIVGSVPAVLLAFTISPLTALLVLVVFLAANQIEAHVLAPLILAKSTDLHPITVLISILIGVGFLGLLGAFVAVPAVALAKLVLEEYLLTRPAYANAPATAGPPGGAAPGVAGPYDDVAADRGTPPT